MAGIDKVISSTMENLKEMIDVNTIVGNAVNAGENVIVIPVSKVAFGFASGGSEYISGDATEPNAFGGGAGGGVTINPVAFLVIENGHVRLVPVSDSVSAVDRIIDSVPELISKANGFITSVMDKRKEAKKTETETSETVVIEE